MAESLVFAMSLDLQDQGGCSLKFGGTYCFILSPNLLVVRPT